MHRCQCILPKYILPKMSLRKTIPHLSKTIGVPCWYLQVCGSLWLPRGKAESPCWRGPQACSEQAWLSHVSRTEHQLPVSSSCREEIPLGDLQGISNLRFMKINPILEFIFEYGKTDQCNEHKQRKSSPDFWYFFWVTVFKDFLILDIIKLLHVWPDISQTSKNLNG